MKRALKIALAALAIGAAVIAGLRFFVYGPEASRTAVILVTAPALRPDHLSCYGYTRINTPAIDDLARKSLLFEYCYADVPLPMAGYASILTGRFGSLAVREVGDHAVLDSSDKFLSSYLKERGYSTALITADAALVPVFRPEKNGFDKVRDAVAELPEKDRLSANSAATQAALETIGGLLKKRRPVFAWVAYGAPLYPHILPESFKKAPGDFPYDRQVLLLDDEIGKLLEGLKKLKLAKNTLIVFTSATGAPLDEHREPLGGVFLYNSSVRVPLIIKLPNTPTGSAIQAGATQADIVPTVLGILKIPYRTDEFDGTSLVPARTGAEGRDICLESTAPRTYFGWSPLAAIISGNFKYIAAPKPELYDLSQDPHELTNIAGTQGSRAEEMRDKLLALVGKRRPELAQMLGKGTDPKDKASLLGKLLAIPLYFQAAKPDRVREAVNKLLEEDPKNRQLRMLLVMLNAQANDFASAEKVLLGLKEEYPGSDLILAALGEANLKLGKDDDAIRYFEESLAIYPDTAPVMNNLAWLYATNGRELDRALKLAKRANELEERAAFIDTLAEVYYRMGDKKKAREELDKALALEPDSEYLKGRLRTLFEEPPQPGDKGRSR